MRALLIAILLALGLYSGYWFLGARLIETRAGAAMDELRARGEMSEGELSVAGFPNRFDVTLAPVALQSSDGQYAWTADLLRLFALSWRPNHVIALFPESQVIDAGPLSFKLESPDMRASAVAGFSKTLPLSRSVLTASALQLVPQPDEDGTPPAMPLPTLQVKSLRLASEAVAGDASRQRLGLELDGITPDAASRALVDSAGRLPAEIDRLHLDATLQLDQPLTLVAGRLPAPQSLRIDDLSAQWGSVGFTATGELARDAQGFLAGELKLKLQDWQAVLQIAQDAGLVADDMAPTYASVLAQLAKLSGDPSRLELPLTLAKGQMRLGPLPIGPAPRI